MGARFDCASFSPSIFNTLVRYGVHKHQPQRGSLPGRLEAPDRSAVASQERDQLIRLHRKASRSGRLHD